MPGVRMEDDGPLRPVEPPVDGFLRVRGGVG